MKRVTYIKLVEEEIEGCWPGTDRLRFSAQVVKVAGPVEEVSDPLLVDVALDREFYPELGRYNKRSAMTRVIEQVVHKHLDKEVQS